MDVMCGCDVWMWGCGCDVGGVVWCGGVDVMCGRGGCGVGVWWGVWT